MRLLWNIVALLFAMTLLSPGAAFADDEDGPDLSQHEMACRGLLSFTAGAVTMVSTGSPGLAITAGLSYMSNATPDSPVMTKCIDAFKRYEQTYRDNPVDYEDFLRRFCNGNPNNCPGNLSVSRFDDWENPRDCTKFIVCSMEILRRTSPEGVSVQDVINAIHFVGYSVNYGYWAVNDYGFLVGLPTHVGDDSGISFDIY